MSIPAVTSTRWVEIPSLVRAIESPTFARVWRSTSNDELDTWESLWSRAGGRERFIEERTSADQWTSFRNLLRAAAVALDVVNLALTALPKTTDQESIDILEGRHMARVEEWAHENSVGIGESVGKVAAEMARWLKREFVLPSRGKHLVEELLELKTYTVEPIDALPKHDVFISYKHVRFSKEAMAMAERLRGMGLSVWIDREMLGDLINKRIPDGMLRRALRTAARSSRCTVFFETWASAEVTPTGTSAAFSWQLFEREHSSSVLHVSPAEAGLFVSGQSSTAPAPDLAAVCSSIVGLVDAERRAEHDGGPRLTGQPPATKPFDDCLSLLESRAADYFGGPVRVSPRAAAALLTPSPIDRLSGIGRVPLGDDVLLRLLDLSPQCALALEAGGIDLRLLFARDRGGPAPAWHPPSTYLFADVHGDGRRPEVVTAARTRGWWDELDLFAALTYCAREFGTAPHHLIASSWCNDSTLEPDVTARMSILSDYVAATELGAAVRPCGQEWILYWTNETIRLRPIVPVAQPEVIGFGDPTTTRVRVYSQHIGPFYRTIGVADVETFLNRGRDVRELELCLRERPMAKWLLDGVRSVAERPMLTCAVDGVIDAGILLEPIRCDGLEPLPELPSSSTLTDRELAERLWEIRDEFRRAPSASPVPLAWKNIETGGPLGLAWRRALVFGELPRRMNVAADASPVSLFALACSTLGPLRRYQRLLELRNESDSI